MNTNNKTPFKFKINIEEINEEFNAEMLRKIKKSFAHISDYIKKIIFLKENETTTIVDYLNPKNESIENSNSSEFISYTLNNTSSNTNDSKLTMCESKTLININNSIIQKEINNSIFNLIRISFYLKNKLNDIPLYTEYNDLNIPPKYQINEINYAFLYPNEIITYCITISGFLKIEIIKTNPSFEENNQKEKFNTLLGLYFCGKDIEIKVENEIHKKKCEPNSFLCNQCVKLNKKLYNIKNNYLINIYGRIAKRNKDRFHCFGHFLIKNQIKDCIDKFCCKGCKILNLYNQYFFEN